MSLYADRLTIFQSPNKARIIDPSITVNDTQFGRFLRELSAELFSARSPQARVRIEFAVELSLADSMFHKPSDGMNRLYPLR
ncbi:hypothetical protein FRZ06_20435 [Anoxybacterium hadale]|uniref:Uncharacterized protein n=1 Tax=Anoxybacterium hadale TaxID=3408580 RepID=A0ACD1AGG9_9FIRM|nr:hypothetical protein FRZ06_20435 [Clostridiales bacterium]